jgi:plasmid stabilization system protein ParE
VTWRLEIRPAALADIDKAAAWYEKREPGLGPQFVRTVRASIHKLLENPLLHSDYNRRSRARWCYPPRFPYRIVYRIDGDLVTIVAVVHSARHERIWKKRL